MPRQEAHSWVGTLAPKQGLRLDPAPEELPAFAKHYAVMNGGEKPITVIVTMLLDAPDA